MVFLSAGIRHLHGLVKTVRVKTYDLEMVQPPTVILTAPASAVTVERIPQPSVEFYRWLYESAGKDWRWVDRKIMSTDALQAIIQNPQVEVYVLHHGGKPAGYVELDRRFGSEIEISYFGIFPEWTGQRLGTFLLNWALHRAWSYQPNRVWLHTCEWDHPAALHTYLRAGLRQINERWVDQVVLTETGAEEA